MVEGVISGGGGLFSGGKGVYCWRGVLLSGGVGV